MDRTTPEGLAVLKASDCEFVKKFRERLTILNEKLRADAPLSKLNDVKKIVDQMRSEDELFIWQSIGRINQFWYSTLVYGSERSDVGLVNRDRLREQNVDEYLTAKAISCDRYLAELTAAV